MIQPFALFFLGGGILFGVPPRQMNEGKLLHVAVTFSDLCCRQHSSVLSSKQVEPSISFPTPSF